MNHSSVQKTSLLINGLFSTIILGMLVLVLFFPDTFKWIIETIGQYSKSIGHWNTLILLIISTIESFPVIGVLVP